MATGDRKDPFRSYNFIVEIDGITRAGFRECSGLDSSQDPIDYREGNQRQTTRKLPGLRKHSNIVLKWGMVTDDKELWDWRQTVIDGNVSRRNGSIVLIDDQGGEKARWNFVDGWPSKWTGPGLNATGNEVALETLEIVHEGLVRA